MNLKRMFVVGLSIVMLVFVLTGCGKKKEETKNYDKENSIENVENNNQENSNINVDEIIKEEINKKEFLTQNNIKESEINTLNYRVIENDKNPIYIVTVDYLPEGKQGNGIIFQVTYQDGKVSFDKIEEHKYISDTIGYDSNKKILKLSASYRETTRNTYFSLKDGKFEIIDLAVKDGIKEYNFVELKETEIKCGKGENNSTNNTTMTEAEALKIAEETYKKAYNVVNGNDDSDTFAYSYMDGSTIDGKEVSFKVDTQKLKNGFTEKGINKILEKSFYSKLNGDYYITGIFVDFVPGIFGATDQGIRPLKIVSYTDNKISATGQITEGEGDHDETPLKIEFVKEGNTWLVNDFE